MPRVKGGYTTRRRRKAVLKMAKGYYGSKNTLYKTANEQVMRSLAYAYRDRKDRKRQFRKLWVTRINAAAMQNGMKYSRFMSGLSKAGIEINRKMLAEMAVNDKEGFKNLVEVAKQNVDKATVKVEENIVVLTRSQIAPANGTPAAKKETTAKKEAAPKAAKEETVKEAAPKKETAPKATKEEAVKEAAPKKAAAKKETAQTEKVERTYASEENLDKIVTKELPKQAQEIEYGTKKTIASYETQEGVKVEIIINKEDSYCLPCLTVAQLRELASYYGLTEASKLKRDELLAYIDSTANRRPGVQVQVSIDGSTPACLECFTVAKLRDLAKIKGLEGYSAMKKADLLQYIIDYATGKF